MADNKKYTSFDSIFKKLLKENNYIENTKGPIKTNTIPECIESLNIIISQRHSMTYDDIYVELPKNIKLILNNLIKLIPQKKTEIILIYKEFKENLRCAKSANAEYGQCEETRDEEGNPNDDCDNSQVNYYESINELFSTIERMKSL
jgi:hypothetical protein